MSEPTIILAPDGDGDDAPSTEVVRAAAPDAPERWPAPGLHRTVLRPVLLQPATPAHQPIIRERAVSRMNPFYLPRARARTGLVLVSARDGIRPVDLKGRRFTSGQVLWAGGTLYEVDLGLHHTSVRFELPAARDTSTFRTSAFVEWRVTVPRQVVQDNLHDVREALAPVLQERLGRVTRRFDVEQVARAEEAAAAEIGRADPGEVYGLQTKIVLRLAADEKGTEYVAVRRELEREIEIENLRQQHRRLQQDHEQELLHSRLELYRAIVASGNVDQFALQLARNPDDVRAVAELLRQERDDERNRTADFLKHLLDSGAVDRWDVEDQVRAALEWLAEATQRAIRITDEGPLGDRAAAPSRNGSASDHQAGRAR